jgi:hypothetical protein
VTSYFAEAELSRWTENVRRFDQAHGRVEAVRARKKTGIRCF